MAKKTAATAEPPLEDEFWDALSLDRLAARQKVSPWKATSLGSCAWLAGEPLDDFLAAVHRWRSGEGDGAGAREAEKGDAGAAKPQAL